MAQDPLRGSAGVEAWSSSGSDPVGQVVDEGHLDEDHRFVGHAGVEEAETPDGRDAGGS